MRRYALVTFLTDYGLDDPFVGLCHAVLAAGAPGARVVDLTHGIEAQDVRHGAVVLADCVGCLPPAVHLAVVDPGVGTSRRPVVVRAGESLLVGPDNGLLWPAAARLGGATGAWEIAARAPGPSRTFDGRDVFAPAAARLAGSVPPDQLGPALAVDAMVRLDLPGPRLSAGRLDAEILLADRFGNLQLAASPADLDMAGLRLGQRLTVNGQPATRCETFAEITGLGVLPDAFGRAQVAVNQGSAAQLLHLRPGDTISIQRQPPDLRLQAPPDLTTALLDEHRCPRVGQ
ncbi:MAG: SAM hydrolase/SAM-dependent halogenase family protein [Egibacteraceae bacterium]